MIKIGNTTKHVRDKDSIIIEWQCSNCKRATIPVLSLPNCFKSINNIDDTDNIDKKYVCKNIIYK